ncbi:putative inorganic carbon transporter subunit DabA [Candidatus Thiothrix sp. Deng01]|uniref:Probable inorganic carbon transporter subunit DabA n=1 Tax=Candidatus Thiothrix phosphatis TaxID=3112415 RepID=A0ABU6CX14_9GAMM|nr:putative inorganic carbon transporter subunit DabA [Candidatus Thiothrix sp. Deng01]MEB4591320.1 putative inorganic carbon transporter subunit DabA [Candidatus Thiothrix sp. Deng01]
MSDPDQLHAEQRECLRQAIAGLDAVLPIQAPLQDFVHFNPLMNYEHLPFAEALRLAHAHSGSLGYLPASEYRRFFRAGRITQHDIFTVLADEPDKFADRALYLTALAHDIKAISFQQMRWQVEENHALERFQADVPFERREQLLEAARQDEATAIRNLWETCLAKLELSYDLPHPEALLNLRLADINEVWERIRQQGQAGQEMENAESFIQAESRRLLHSLLDQVGATLTLRGLLLKLTNTDVMEQMLPLLERYLASWLDQGVAALHPPVMAENEGFYHYWREAVQHDPTPWLTGMEDWSDYIGSLQDDPLETIHQEMIRIGIDKQHWGGYLQALALELPGWSGMFNWRARNPHYLSLPRPASMEDYLAVRLVLEHLFCRQIASSQWQVNATLHTIRGYFHHNQDEFFVRYHVWNAALPEYLQQLALQFLDSLEDVQPQEWRQLAHQILTWNLAPETVIPVGADIYRKAWRLFHLAQHLGMDAAAFATLERAQIDRQLAILQELDDPNTSGYLWLRAYEHHYQEAIFSALLNRHADSDTRALSAPPAAQLIFCMDDREESIRRHLEELAPKLETFGAAGVFGLPSNWWALDADQPLKLAQPVVTAVHEFRETPADGQQQRMAAHQRRQRRLRWLQRLKNHQMRHSVIGAALALPLLAPFGLLEMAGRSLAPSAYQRFLTRMRRTFNTPPQTRVAYTAAEVLPHPDKEHNQLGLSLEEKVAKVAAFLKLTGFTGGFAPLVVLMAHRSHHINNPHILGYGCGACSGRFGGPNARAFAGSANEQEVRAQLAAQHGIYIPDGCWFIASEHDTTSDSIDWFDLDLLPAEHHTLFQRVREATEQAARQSAHERCRKFASAHRRLTPRQAKQHVEGRAASPDQARAELGHQGCAVAFIGRRSLSKDLFWDRRSFLISYDPYADPDGKLLEAQLQGNGVVGVGIAMDYYFSRMQSGYFGSGSKVTHNLTGLFGVMEGGSSDLRTGLAQQMVELHEPMRLLVVAEAETDTLAAVYQRHDYLRRLLDNGWVLLAAKPPDRNEIHLFQPGRGFVQWRGAVNPLPLAARSLDWYGGHHDHLPPAWITPAPEVNHA